MSSWRVLTGKWQVVLPKNVLAVDHVICDPPYDERTHATACTGSTRNLAKKRSKDVFTGVSFDAMSLDEMAEVVSLSKLAKRWCIAFCSAEMIGEYARLCGKEWVRPGIWDKIIPTPQISGDRPGMGAEFLAIWHRSGRKRWNGGGRPAIWRHIGARGDERTGHPTPKPLALMAELISDFTDPGDTILDPYCGSGTTLVAAIRLGRNAIGCELNPEWAEIARQRCEAESNNSDLRSQRAGQIPLFGGT